MLDNIERYLRIKEYDNHIYFGLSTEEYEKIKELLNNDYGYLDVVLDFFDTDLLDDLIKYYLDFNVKSIRVNMIYEKYLSYKIIKQIGSSFFFAFCNIDNSINLEDALYDDKFSKYFNLHFVINLFMMKEAKLRNRKIRLHIFLDSINNKEFNEYINNFFGSLMNLSVIGYTKEDFLKINVTSDGYNLVENKDYYRYVRERKI